MTFQLFLPQQPTEHRKIHHLGSISPAIITPTNCHHEHQTENAILQAYTPFLLSPIYPPPPTNQPANSFFKTLVDHEVTIELKNDLSIRGTLKSVDQFLNIKLDDVMVLEEAKYPHLAAVRNVFIRGSVVRYVHLPAGAVDTALLEDATRRGMFVFLAVGGRDRGLTGGGGLFRG